MIAHYLLPTKLGSRALNRWAWTNIGHWRNLSSAS